ncbi:MAG: ATP-grasp domain-containing protein, partial [Planctomycetota bacterium]|nr:ATP-grasp domain-containing protein [Planctomycetota bacterium]
MDIDRTPYARRRLLLHEWVTGGGLAGESPPESWLREGRAMRAALARDFAALPDLDVVATIDARFPEEPGATWSSVPIGPGEEKSRLLEIARDSDYTLAIAPETGGILAERALWLDATPTRSLGSSAASIAVAGDKGRLATLLKAAGIRAPRTAIVHPYAGHTPAFNGPTVLKPIDGAGCTDTFYSNTHYHHMQLSTIRQMVLQQYVRGIPSSASFLLDVSGRAILIAVGRQDVVITNGRFSYRGGSIPAPRNRADDQVRAAAGIVPG